MGLSLVVGPAHAGKVALLLDRFVEELDRDPWLVVPNRVEADRAERELVARCNGLLAGTVGTFDSLFESLAWANGDGKVVCYFQAADKFKSRYATFGFNDSASLDDGAVWATSWAVSCDSAGRSFRRPSSASSATCGRTGSTSRCSRSCSCRTRSIRMVA